MNHHERLPITTACGMHDNAPAGLPDVYYYQLVTHPSGYSSHYTPFKLDSLINALSYHSQRLGIILAMKMH